MTNEQIEEMGKMRNDGYTLQEIADKFGVSKQWVAQLIPTGGYKMNPETLDKMVYPNIANWMRKNHYNMRKLVSETGLTLQTLRRMLIEGRDPRKYQIDKILKVTGLTYEVAFYKEEQKDAEN